MRNFVTLAVEIGILLGVVALISYISSRFTDFQPRSITEKANGFIDGCLNFFGGNK